MHAEVSRLATGDHFESAGAYPSLLVPSPFDQESVFFFLFTVANSLSDKKGNNQSALHYEKNNTRKKWVNIKI